MNPGIQFDTGLEFMKVSFNFTDWLEFVFIKFAEKIGELNKEQRKF